MSPMTSGRYCHTIVRSIPFIVLYVLISTQHCCNGFTSYPTNGLFLPQDLHLTKGARNHHVSQEGISSRRRRRRRRRQAKIALNVQDTDSSSNNKSDERECHSRRRSLLNQILVGSLTVGVVDGGLSLPAQAFFGSSNNNNNNSDDKSSEKTKKTTTAKDIYGSDLVAQSYVATHKGGDRSMVQGLKNEPTFLIVNADTLNLESYALNAECTHLGCVVPWDEFQKKFVCPCHGSQYDSTGMVLRGPAPHPLALAHVTTDDDNGGKITLSPWTEDDFRTNEKPWWI